MGILSATGAADVTAEPQGGGDALGAELEGAEPIEQVIEPDVPPDPTALEPPKPKGSRRQRAARELAETVSKSLREQFEKDRETDRQQIRTLQQQLEYQRGAFEAYQRQPPQAAAPTKPAEDPDEIERQAAGFLDPGKENYAEYQRLMRKSYEIRAEKIADARVKAAMADVEKRIPAQIPPHISALLGRHHNVALAGDRGSTAVQIKLQELQLMGAPNSPETLSKAFELADQWLAQLNGGGQAQRQQTNGHGGALPTNRGGSTAQAAGGAAEAAALTAQQKAAAARGGFKDEDDYRRWSDPAFLAKVASSKWG